MPKVRRGCWTCQINIRVYSRGPFNSRSVLCNPSRCIAFPSCLPPFYHACIYVVLSIPGTGRAHPFSGTPPTTPLILGFHFSQIPRLPRSTGHSILACECTSPPEPPIPREVGTLCFFLVPVGLHTYTCSWPPRTSAPRIRGSSLEAALRSVLNTGNNPVLSFDSMNLRR